PVAALVEGALGAPLSGLSPTLGGFSHLSRRALIGGRACVIKAAHLPLKRADLRREAVALPLLPALNVPAPPLLGLVDDDTWTVLVVGELPGQPGVALLEGDPGALPAAFAALGGILARLHAAPAPDLPALALAPRLAAARAALAAPDLEDNLRAPLAAALAHPAWAAAPPRLIHGDAGMHNLLWDDGRAALLDWEWSAVGPPALDLAWLRWTMRWRGLPEGLWRAALDAYALPAPELTILDALALGQIALILARVAEQPAARAEWLRRARWTIR
ncbi:phosphotransferase, partial [Oscillochloris sp. ZM17-4]|uniref:phosphotransferase family protein n=1 Tax=Oscillochloris sp. ZM17-4 TaxID=2866714 RepID=UPI001C72A24A